MRHGRGRAGITMVPEKSGAWGWLLPAGSQRARSPEDPSILYNVVEINPACLRLVDPTENLRGLGIVMTIMFSLMLLLIATNFILFYDTATRGYGGEYLAFVAGGSLLGVFGLWRAYRAASAPMQYTSIISRRLRRIYAWSRKGGWISVDYDRAVAFIFRGRLVAPTGASAPVVSLRVAELEPGSRRIARCVAPTRIFSSREAAAGAWQFIRRYMDEDPAAVPPVVLMPNHRINAFAWMDRELFTEEIDRQHYPAGLFDGFAFWIIAGAYYLPNWMEYWVRRYGKRPPLPPELAAALQWEGENPYRVVPPTPEETLAMQGKLPHMKKRWLHASILGILLWGVLPLGFVLVTVLKWIASSN